MAYQISLRMGHYDCWPEYRAGHDAAGDKWSQGMIYVSNFTGRTVGCAVGAAGIKLSMTARRRPSFRSVSCWHPTSAARRSPPAV